MQIVSRAQWGAIYQDGYDTARLPATNCILHHSATTAPLPTASGDTEGAAMRALERIGQERFGVGMSYTFAVFPSGNVYQGVSIGRASPHTLNHNFDSRAIVMVGNYDASPPNAAMRNAIAGLVVEGHRSGWWSTPILSGGHKDFERAGYTECPGRAGEASIAAINTIIRTGVPVSETNPTLAEIRDLVGAELYNRLTDATHANYFPTVRGDIAALSRKVDSLTAIELPVAQILNILQTLTKTPQP